MKLFDYCNYFWFVWDNWSFKLALFTVAWEIKGEHKYHVDTIRINKLHDADVQSVNLKHSFIYQASSYYLLEKAFDYLTKHGVRNHFMDFGCGKGRALAVAAYYGFKKVTGIDFSPVLCKDAEQNIENIQSFHPATHFEIICEDAVNQKIEKDVDVFFFFNPFDEVVMREVVKNMLLSLTQSPRKIYVVYVNPLHEDIFINAGFDEVYYLKKLDYLEMSILSNSDA